LTSSPGVSRAVVTTAFVVIVTFVLVQVTWWLVFQDRYLTEVTEERLHSWEADATSSNELLRLALEGPGPAAAGFEGGEAATPLVDDLLDRYPHLTWTGTAFEVDREARDEFVSQQRSYWRMFFFEAPFFALVVLLALLLIGRGLRAERELKALQQNFISAVTHEFNTPISTLRLLIESAQLRRLPREKWDENLRRMASELGRLERLSAQVLTTMRLQQGTPVPLERFDLNVLVGRLLERMSQAAHTRGAEIRFVPAEGDVPVSAERESVELILNNLVENAIKYTPGSRKPVTVRVERDGDLALLHVEDEGQGLKPGEERKIFARFYRSGDEMTRRSAGVGLGLYLVKNAAEAMNGWVRASNRDDRRGARFTVVLPLRVAGNTDGQLLLEGSR